MSRHRLVLLVVLAAVPAVARGQVKVGSEFRVNSFTTSDQIYPAVAADGAGNFIVVWESIDQDGDGVGVFGRFHDATGAPLGASEFRVNANTPTHQSAAEVAATPDGRVVVVWESVLQDGSGAGIYARQYASPTAPPGPEIPVNVYTTGTQFFPAVAADAAGNFVVVWASNQDGSAYAVVGRRFDALGQPRGGEFLVNSVITNSQTAPAVASDAAGNFVVVWHSLGQDGDNTGIFAQRYDATGARVGGEFRVNVETVGGQSYPAVAADAEGNFVVAWTSPTGGLADIWARRYDAAGLSPGGEFRVNDYTTGPQGAAAVAMDPDGRFTVAWRSEPQDGSGLGAFARRYDAAGVPEGAPFRLNTYVANDQSVPRVAADGRGNFVSVWQSVQDGSGRGVYAQRWKPDLIFGDGFDDGTMDAWSFSATDSGDLAVSALAGLNFTAAGLLGVVDDTAGLYVQDDRPDGEALYRARFYFDPATFDPGEAQNHFRTRLFLAFSEAPTRRVAAVVLRRLGNAYSVRGRARRDDNTQADTPFIPIAAGPHVIEILLSRATAPGVTSGVLQLFVDGDSVASVALANSLAEVDFVRLGALSVKVGANGTVYWDEFESRRQGYIGP